MRLIWWIIEEVFWPLKLAWWLVSFPFVTVWQIMEIRRLGKLQRKMEEELRAKGG
ncbi:MAG TPA: hypothetical protein VK514_13205 [Candidatus Acidoferrum sp.]|nr:hypothetical protein [Candidatus Acidoferrum sp.]